MGDKNELYSGNPGNIFDYEKYLNGRKLDRESSKKFNFSSVSLGSIKKAYLSIKFGGKNGDKKLNAAISDLEASIASGNEMIDRHNSDYDSAAQQLASNRDAVKRDELMDKMNSTQTEIGKLDKAVAKAQGELNDLKAFREMRQAGDDYIEPEEPKAAFTKPTSFSQNSSNSQPFSPINPYKPNEELSSVFGFQPAASNSDNLGENPYSRKKSAASQPISDDQFSINEDEIASNGDLNVDGATKKEKFAGWGVTGEEMDDAYDKYRDTLPVSVDNAEDIEENLSNDDASLADNNPFSLNNPFGSDPYDSVKDSDYDMISDDQDLQAPNVDEEAQLTVDENEEPSLETPVLDIADNLDIDTDDASIDAEIQPSIDTPQVPHLDRIDSSELLSDLKDSIGNLANSSINVEELLQNLTDSLNAFVSGVQASANNKIADERNQNRAKMLQKEKEYSKRVSKLKQEHTEKMQQKDDEIKSINETHEEAMKAKDDEITKLKSTHSDELEALKESHKEEIGVYKVTASAQQDTIKSQEETISDLEEEKANLTQTVIDRDSEINQLTEEKHQLELTIGSKNQEIVALKDKNTKLENQVSDLKTQVGQLTEKVERNDRQLSELKKLMSGFSDSLSNMFNTNAASVSSRSDRYAAQGQVSEYNPQQFGQPSQGGYAKK